MARAILMRTVEAARAVVATRALEGAVAFLPARAERTVPAFSTGAERFISVSAAERSVATLARLAGALVAAAGAEGAVSVFAGLAEGPIPGGAAAVGASRRTALTIIVIAVGHGGLIAEDGKRSEAYG
jgi:hypothetical protein